MHPNNDFTLDRECIFDAGTMLVKLLREELQSICKKLI